MNRNQRQTRTLPARFETRGPVEGKSGPVICGYFAVFNSDYEMWPGEIERVAPGAFAGSLGGDIRALIDHETRLVLGRTSSGTLVLREDEVGLYNTVDLYFEEDDLVETYRLVTTVRGNTLNGSVSIESPIGKAILGKKVGDRVYVSVSETAGYYVVIRRIEKTQDDGTDKLRGF